jgi:putative aldouronate transport system substrate-binding protein
MFRRKFSAGVFVLPCLILAVCVFFAGCGGKKDSGTSSSAPGRTGVSAGVSGGDAIDLSKKVDIVLYVTGRTPDQFDKIQAKLNEITMRDLNCTVSYSFFNAPDNQQKYMLILSSGETVDLLYSANYLNYAANSIRGAFQKLDDLIPKYSPALWEYVGQDGWNAARVNGDIFMIPCMWKEYNLFGFTYREDLRVKHGLPLPDSIQNIEIYLRGIKNNEPDMTPTGEIVQSSAVSNLGIYFRAFEVFDAKYRWIDWRMPYGLMIEYDNPKNVTNYWRSKDFRDDMKLLKKWADEGFWSKNALSNTVDPKDAMLAGKVAAQLGFTSYATGVDYTREAKRNNPSTEMIFATIPYAYAKKQSVAVHPTQNGFSLPITAANTERAIALYEKLVLDREYFNLMQYGIENEDFRIVDNTYVEIPGGFGREAARLWAARNDALYLPSGNWQDYEPFKQKFAEYEGPNKIGGFVEDTTPYQAERAALMNVVTQYLVPLQAGMVDNVDAAIDEFLRNAEAAGMDKLHELYIKQWYAHVDANNEWK